MCDYCDTVHVPSLREDAIVEKIQNVTVRTNCSLCSTEFSAAKTGQVTFLYCDSCGGMLVNQSDLLSLIKYVRAEQRTKERRPNLISQEELGRSISCPTCQQEMHTHEYYGPGDFVIDSCSNCRKIWLDGGELSKAATVRWGGTLWG